MFADPFKLPTQQEIPKHDPGHNKPSSSRMNEPYQSVQPKRDWGKQQHRSSASGPSRHDWSNRDRKYEDTGHRKRGHYENPKASGWYDEHKAKRKKEWH
ncbi:hypothetical protein RP20_CCG004769 [Aedes albopictus]|nr:hypothetical protein RP20_CCG004769 [Aedes albopictus]